MKILFKVKTPLGVIVRTTTEYWRYIVEVKHRIMAGKEEEVKKTLEEPDEVRRSKTAQNILLYYRKFDKLYCVVIKQENDEGFIITAYPTDKVKEGEIIWKK